MICIHKSTLCITLKYYFSKTQKREYDLQSFKKSLCFKFRFLTTFYCYSLYKIAVIADKYKLCLCFRNSICNVL